MNTSTEAINQLQQALEIAQQAADTIENLIAPHDFQDVATLSTQAASALLLTAIQFLQKNDESALEALETAEDLIDSLYGIIEEDTGDL